MPDRIITVCGAFGKRAAPYRILGDVLVKRCSKRHIFRARQAVGVDEDVWNVYKDHISVVRFEFEDGRVYEIRRGEFEQKSFPHGDGLTFAKTLFVPISELTLREAQPARGQLALAF